MIIKRLDMPCRLCPTEEETFQGLLAIALVASGQAENLAEASTLVAQTAD
jgi:hypothetical protein